MRECLSMGLYVCSLSRNNNHEVEIVEDYRGATSGENEFESGDRLRDR